MITNFKFKLTPNQALYPDNPPFDMIVTRSGLVFKDYTWRCLPGNIAETSGFVDVSIQTDFNHYTYLFYPKSKGFFDFDNYVSLEGVPKDLKIGATGFAMITYGGLSKNLPPGKSEDILGGNWLLINAF